VVQSEEEKKIVSQNSRMSKGVVVVALVGCLRASSSMLCRSRMWVQDCSPSLGRFVGLLQWGDLATPNLFVDFCS
jgi:hypothetical protein